MLSTVRNIAAKAGVSPATVSRVVNGTEGVSPEKRARVLKILRAPSTEPLKLRRKKLRIGNIGFLMLPEGIIDPSIRIQKLQEIAGRLPKNWNLVALPENLHPLELESKFLRREVSGLLIFGHHPEPELTRVLERIPHVWLNSYFVRGTEKMTLMGNEFAGRIAARYLFSSGCKNPAVLSVSSSNPGFPSRVEGFRIECFSVHANCTTLELPETAALKSDENTGTGFESDSDTLLDARFMLFLKRNDLSIYDGFFCPEEKLTAFLYRAMSRKNLVKRPRIVSCNHTPEFLAGLYPRPASVDLGPRMLAWLGVEELLRRISGEPKKADNIATIVTPQLIPGD